MSLPEILELLLFLCVADFMRWKESKCLIVVKNDNKYTKNEKY